MCNPWSITAGNHSHRPRGQPPGAVSTVGGGKPPDVHAHSEPDWGSQAPCWSALQGGSEEGPAGGPQGQCGPGEPGWADTDGTGGFGGPRPWGSCQGVVLSWACSLRLCPSAEMATPGFAQATASHRLSNACALPCSVSPDSESHLWRAGDEGAGGTAERLSVQLQRCRGSGDHLSRRA